MADNETSADAGAEAPAAADEPTKKKAGFLNLKDPNLLPAAFIAIGLIVGGRMSAPPAPAAAEKAAVEATAATEEPAADDDGAMLEDESPEETTETSTVAAAEEETDSEPRSLAERAAQPGGSSRTASSSVWSYDNTDEWGELSDEYAACADGSAQSPIDIKDPLVIGLTDLRFAYQPSVMTVTDTGYAIKAMIPAGSTLTIDGMAFTLRHLQFRAPSEHTVRGRSFPAEVQLVHETADGTLAVVAMMIEVGDEHPAIAQLWASISGEGETMDTATAVDPNVLLPGNRSAIRYLGSLSTPPCTEAVRWNLLVEPITMSQNQLDALTSIHVGNARPVQATNGRPVVVDSGPDA